MKRVLEAARREREAGVYYPSSSSYEVPQKQKGERLREKRKRKCVGYCVSLFCALL